MEGQCFWTIEYSNTIFPKIQALQNEGDTHNILLQLHSFFPIAVLVRVHGRREIAETWTCTLFLQFLRPFVKRDKILQAGWEKVSELEVPSASPAPKCCNHTANLPASSRSGLNNWQEQSGNPSPIPCNCNVGEKHRFSKQSFLLQLTTASCPQILQASFSVILSYRWVGLKALIHVIEEDKKQVSQEQLWFSGSTELLEVVFCTLETAEVLPTIRLLRSYTSLHV